MGCFSALKPRKRKIPNLNSNSTQRPPIRSESTAVRLPEPGQQQQQTGPSLQSAPPSFRNRTKAPPQSSINRIRALSAPSSLVLSDQAVQDQYQYQEQESISALHCHDQDNKTRFSNALPLPLPSPEEEEESGGHIYNLRNLGSFKSNVSGPLGFSGPLPLPPTVGNDGVRNFSYDEVATASQNFSNCVYEGISVIMYKATFGDDFGATKKIDTTLIRLLNSSQSWKEFISEVNTVASLDHLNLCKLVGFHGQDGSSERMLVYERLHHGSLDRLVHGRPEGGGPTMDWSTRMKVAFNAAKGLAFLHEEGPFQAMYNEFSAANIQIDKDFTAKLSGYGCVSHNINLDITNNSSVIASLSVETLEKGVLTPKSNVYSFGIILLELITGRKNLDPRYPKEERNLVKWSKPFLTDDCRLSLILDPKLKGRFPAKAARIVANIIIKCVCKEPKERPTMRGIVDLLGGVRDIKYFGRYPLQEPKEGGKFMGRYPSFNGIGSVSSPPLPPPRSSSISMIVSTN